MTSDNTKPVTVAYQGGPGAYSELAAERHFAALGRPTVCTGYVDFRSMLGAVTNGQAEYAMLPIENTIAGSIHENYDLLLKLGLSIVGEEIQSIEHCLIGMQGASVDSLRRVLSHPVALAQCGRFLQTLTQCKAEVFSDTALAVAEVGRLGDPTVAAIASERAATRYGLPILRREIADQPMNFTRMMVVARRAIEPVAGTKAKTSLVFSTAHEKGALAGCINEFALHGLNLTKIESRPKPDAPFEYLFYLDFEGSLADDNVQRAMKAFEKRTSFVRVFGSYPVR